MKRMRQQQGVALLVVLILLVMMSALAAKISQQFCRNLQKTHYQVSQQQLRWAMQAQEKSGEGPVTDRHQWREQAAGAGRRLASAAGDAG
ncbi:General secretion pathway protein K [Enterobacter hormaechei]|nr:General secretion pathway protein K [Enterobacter hormaechei]